MSEETTYQCNNCSQKITGQSAAALHVNSEHPEPGLQPLDKASIKLVPIPHVPVSVENGKLNVGEPTHAHIISHGGGGRKMVVVKHNGVHVPFYCSSGLAGKDTGQPGGVPSGKWYPFFGIGSGGWINKGSSDGINNHYGSPELEHIAKTLDKHFGDVRNDKTIPQASGRDERHVPFINSLLPHEPSAEADDFEGHKNGFYPNIRHIVKSLKDSRRTNA